MSDKKEEWKINKFYGGLSRGSKVGFAGAYRRGTRLDARFDPDGIQIARGLGKESGGIVVDRVDTLISTAIGANIILYGIGRAGNIYERRDTWVNLRTIPGGIGLGCGIFNDYLYYSDDTTLGRYGPLTGVGSFDDEFVTLETLADYPRFTARRPMENFLNLLCIGNGRYLTTIDSDGIVTPAALTFPPGTMVTCVKVFGTLLYIGTVDRLEQGFVYLWDGVSDTYNSFFGIPAGGVHTLQATSLFLLILAGPQLAIYRYNGGAPDNIYDILNIDEGKYAEVVSATVHRTIPLFAVAAETDDPNLELGVYGYGSVDTNYPDALTIDHTPSDDGDNLKIGAVHSAGSNLYVAWESDNGAGIDKLGENPGDSAIYESMVFDAGHPHRKKTFYQCHLNYEPLLVNESIRVSYKADRAAAWTVLGTFDEVGSVKATFAFNAASGAGYMQAYEMQMQVELLNAAQNILDEAGEIVLDEAGEAVTEESGTSSPLVFSLVTEYSIGEAV